MSRKKIIDDLVQHAAERASDMIQNTAELLDDEEDKAIYYAEVFGHLALAHGATTLFWIGGDQKGNLNRQNILDLTALGLLAHVAHIFAHEHSLNIGSNYRASTHGAMQLFEKIFARKFSLKVAAGKRRKQR